MRDREQGAALRILHVVPRLANSSGPTHIAIALAEGQARLGHVVRIMTVTRAGEWTSLPDQALVEVESHKQTLGFRNFCYSRSFGRALPEAVRKADIVHIHTIWTYPTWATMRECVRQGVPYVVAPQGSFEEWALARSRVLKLVYGALFERPLYRKAARFQALTEKEAQQGERFGVGTRAVVIPNPVDVEAIDRIEDGGEARRQHGVADDEKVVLFLGRLFPKKGLELLADLHKRVLAERDDVVLWIAGSDAGTKYRKRIEERFAEAGVTERVRFIGEVYGEHKVRVLKESDVFVLPSYSEGQPVAVLEAMAAGVAAVITPGCNLPEMVECDAGWVCAPESGPLAEAVLEALGSGERRAAKVRNARELVRSRFSSHGVAGQTLEAYREILSEGGRGTGTSGRSRRRAVVGLWILSLLLTAAVLYLSWVPDSHVGRIGWIPQWLGDWADSGGRMETLRTGVPLAVAGLLFSLAWRATGWRHWALGGVGMAALLVLVAEGGQRLVSTRLAHWDDVWWGIGGAVGGVCLATVGSWTVRRLRRRKSGPE